jgi:hypothetical protein
MPDDIRVEETPAAPHLTLNTDGKHHTLLNGLTVFVCVGGIVAFALGLIVRTHLAATVLGLICFGLGLYLQFVSATRGERMLIVVGIIGGFVGAGLGIAHGGFSLSP